MRKTLSAIELNFKLHGQILQGNKILLHLLQKQHLNDCGDSVG